jgi:hypothetical protein
MTRQVIARCGDISVDAVRHGDVPPFGYVYEIRHDHVMVEQFSTLAEVVQYLRAHRCG